MMTAVAPAFAQQTNFFSSWENRARNTLSKQPSWPVPVVAPSSNLVQLFRTDFVRQITPTHTDTWIYGNTKGFDFVPWYRTEFDVLIPPYIQHNSKAKDGFGDYSMLLKYRAYARDEKHGNDALSFSIGGTLPTGSWSNGSVAGTYSPAVYGGKGFGNFVIQSSLSATLPATNEKTLGRPVAWNTVAQYHLGKLLWPEIENNATFYHDGSNDGRMQNFITPALMISKFKLEKDPQNRLAIFVGAGMQMATSHFHSYNHELAITTRISF